MANIRQYIGARYVFKIYENSQDPSSAEWEQGVTYEPLTIVTYLNSTYASKKDVPGSIGDPASNPSYWVVTGAYNGQIATLQQQIDTINNVTIPAIQNEIQDIINSSKEMNVVLIGDSYSTSTHLSTGENPFPYYFNQYADPDYLNTDACEDGTSFTATTPHNWATALTNVYSNMTSDRADSITHIIIAGGANDYNASESDLYNAMESFSIYAKAHFPNAKIYVAMIGSGQFSGSLVRPQYYKVAQRYANNCAMLGMKYITNSEYTLLNDNMFGSDIYHPNDAGEKAIAITLLQGINAGVDIYRIAHATYSFISGVTAHTLADFEIQHNDNLILAFTGGITLDGSVGFANNGNKVKIADISTTLLHGAFTGATPSPLKTFNCEALAEIGGSYKSVMLNIGIRNNELWLGLRDDSQSTNATINPTNINISVQGISFFTNPLLASL